MKSLLSPQPSLPTHITEPRTNLSRSKVTSSLRFDRDRWIGRKKCGLTLSAVLDPATIDQFGISESEFVNPAVSTSYRSSKLPKPNQTVLDAQARVCTGPTQTKPLNEDQAFKVFDTILRSGELIIFSSLSLPLFFRFFFFNIFIQFNIIL